MPYAPAAVANSFLALALESGRELTHMQLQKLVYFNHGWNLGLEEGPLCDEYAQAWQYGPVFPSLYQDLKRWGRNPVEEPIVNSSGFTGKLRFQKQHEMPFLESGDTFAIALNEKVWEVYGELTGFQLSAVSHDPEGPWHKTRQKTFGDRNANIPNSLIGEYFAKQRATAS